MERIPRLERIEEEVKILGALYYTPKQKGVINLDAPQCFRKKLFERLDLLVNQGRRYRNSERVSSLITELDEMGKSLGYDRRGYVFTEKYSQIGLDLSKPLPSKDGVPFFSWYWEEPLIAKNQRERFGTRVLGPIDVSNETEVMALEDYQAAPLIEAALNGSELPNLDELPGSDFGGIIIQYKPRRAMELHGLKIDRKYLRRGSDTALRFEFDFLMNDGFMSAVSFYFNKGALMSIKAGQKELDIRSAFALILQQTNVSPLHIRYYIKHSNLAEEDRKSIAGLLEVLSRSPEVDASVLFPFQIGADKKDQSIIDLSKHFPFYEDVSLTGMSFDELKQIVIPNEHLEYAFVNFQSKFGKSYHANFIAEHPKGPYILMGQEGEKDEEDFERVNDFFERLRDVTTSYPGVYNLRNRPTQESIANLGKGVLLNHFEKIRLGRVQYQLVPMGLIDNSKLILSSQTIKVERGDRILTPDI